MTPRVLKAFSLVFLLVLPGCSEFNRKRPSEQAQQRWNHMRARVKLQLAERSFGNGAIDDALSQCNEVIGLDPEFAEGHVLLTRIHLERGDVSKAQAALSAAASLAPTAPEVFYLQGLIAERQGRSQDALKYYQEAYQAQPDEVDYLLTYVESLMAADQYDKALEVVLPRRKDFEQTAAVHAVTGQLFSLLGRPVQAAECYLLAVHLAPKSHLLREEAGAAFVAAGWYEDAAETLNPLVELPATQASNAHAGEPSIGAIRNLATALLQTGKVNRAVQVLERASKKYPDDPSIWILTADAHLRCGDLEQAAQAARKAAATAPDQPDIQLLLIYHALQTGLIQQAIDAAQRMVDRRPGDVEARAMLALAWERAPNGIPKAAEQYRRILSMFPAHRWAQRQLERLNQQACAP